jgi:hypothetical protein
MSTQTQSQRDSLDDHNKMRHTLFMTTRIQIIRVTGKQLTLIVAALVVSGLPGAKALAEKLLKQVK